MASSSISMSSASHSQSSKPNRKRIPKTCGECRRLKLKCDRVFPCQSCLKRGCEGICPEGSLVSGRGSRYILANTEQLHEKIIRMADRIKELEEALRQKSEEHARCSNVGSSSSDLPHPLLREDLLLIKKQLELYGPDRSQLTPRSEASYTGDMAETESPKLGDGEQSIPSPLEALILSSAAQLMDSQQAQYNGYNTTSQATSSMPLSPTQGSGNPHSSSRFHAEVQPSSPVATTYGSYSSTDDTMAALDYLLKNFYDSGSSLSSQGGMEPSAAHRYDAHQFANDLLAQNQAELMDYTCSIWDLEKCSV